MIVTVYSFFTAVLCFNLFIFIFHMLRKKLDIYSGFNFYPIALVILLTVVRLLVPIEFTQTKEVNVGVVLPVVQMFLQSYVLGGSFPVANFAVIVSIAVLVSISLFCIYARNLLEDSKYLQGLQPTDNDKLVTLLDEVMDETGVRNPCAIIVVLSGISNPMLCGLKRPLILLPEKCLGLNDYDIKAILQHEWQHYLNKYLWIKVMNTLLCCIMWWNPAVYLLKNSLDKTLELKCDLDVAKNMSEKEIIRYMESIMNLGKLLSEVEEGEGPVVANPIQSNLSVPFVGVSTERAEVGCDHSVHFRMMLPFERRSHRASVISCVVMVAVFFASYGFVIQPFIHVYENDFFVQVDESDYVVFEGAGTETAYIIVSEDGTYSLYFQGVFWGNIESDADLESVLQLFSRFGEMPIIPRYIVD